MTQSSAPQIPVRRVSKWLLAFGAMVIIAYTIYIVFLVPPGNTILFLLLAASQLFFCFQGLAFIYTIWHIRTANIPDMQFSEAVDIFITVCGEPAEVVRKTALAAKAMDYSALHIYFLNDGKVAQKDNWQEIEELATELQLGCITRTEPGGAKAGNINNALMQTHSPFIVIFDADHISHSDFLQKTMPYFADSQVGFVQSPQYYQNYKTNLITRAAWEQQALFFGPICQGKNGLNSTFMCGTNMVMRRAALMEAGGMCETNIAEDFLTSLFIHQRGWKSVYVGEVLAEGLAPEDFLSYYNQQFRWARGSLEVVFKYNPLLMRGLSFARRIQYLASASYYLSGIFVLINMLLPVIYFYFGSVPLTASGMSIAIFFTPYIFTCLYLLQLTSNHSYTFRALAFSHGSFYLQLKAIYSVLFNVKTSFQVTSKTKVSGNFIRLVLPHIFYILVVIVGVIFAYLRVGLDVTLVNNITWALLHIVIFTVFIYAALPVSNQKQR
jgi:cellulose synthase (UDP-forming)